MVGSGQCSVVEWSGVWGGAVRCGAVWCSGCCVVEEGSGVVGSGQCSVV